MNVKIIFKIYYKRFCRIVTSFYLACTSLKALREVDKKSNIESMDIKIEW